MNLSSSLLMKSVVKPFYRENAGLLCFVYYVMFLGVGRANGVGVLDYQYSLIQGMFGDYVFLSVVFFVWMMYALKCSNFISVTLRRPEFSYLYMLSHLRSSKLYVMLLQV